MTTAEPGEIAAAQDAVTPVWYADMVIRALDGHLLDAAARYRAQQEVAK